MKLSGNLLPVTFCLILFGCSQGNEDTTKELPVERQSKTRGEITEPSEAITYSRKAEKFKELETMVESRQLNDAMILSDELTDEFGYNAFIIAHKSMACSGMINSIEDNKEIESYLKQAINYANEAMALDSSIKWSNLAMALAYAKQANFSGFSHKASYSKLANKYSKRVLAIDPNDPTSNFILGRFYLEVSDLSGPASLMARPLLGKEEIDKASFDLALSYLEKSCRMQPNRFIYMYYTGIVLTKLDKDQEALKYFERAKALTPQSKQEQELYQELDKLIKKVS